MKRKRDLAVGNETKRKKKLHRETNKSLKRRRQGKLEKKRKAPRKRHNSTLSSDSSNCSRELASQKETLGTFSLSLSCFMFHSCLPGLSFLTFLETGLCFLHLRDFLASFIQSSSIRRFSFVVSFVLVSFQFSIWFAGVKSASRCQTSSGLKIGSLSSSASAESLRLADSSSHDNLEADSQLVAAAHIIFRARLIDSRSFFTRFLLILLIMVKIFPFDYFFAFPLMLHIESNFTILNVKLDLSHLRFKSVFLRSSASLLPD